MNRFKLAGLVTLMVVVAVILFLTVNHKEVSSEISNESIIIIDNKNLVSYTEYTDELELTHSLDQSTKLVDESKRLIERKQEKERIIAQQKRIAEALRVKEEKRKAEEKRIAAEKAKKVELARIAEEKRQIELAKVAAEKAEAKRMADLEDKRVAKNKAKAEAKKNNSKAVVASRSNGYQSNYEVTFYTAFCDTGCTGVTASGIDVSNTIYHQGYRIVAAPPNIPLGTKLRITFSNGSTMDAIAADRGGAIQGKILDILVSSHAEAVANGRQQVKVEVLN